MFIIPLFLLMSSMAFAAPPAPAGEHSQGSEKRQINKEQAAKIVRKNSQGKLLELRRQGNIYKAKVLDKGRVQIIKVDSVTGEVRR